jgi:2-hydroxy-4-carboxymuconate semialdehyde hemiacetal dehydrogenase
MNIGMIGYGMMGVWHSEALAGTDAVRHTVVGRREEAAKEFAGRYGYRKWTTELDTALADPEIDAVIVASPSELHEAHAIRCLEAGKPTLLEIPIAMSLEGAKRVVAAAERAGVPFGLCHPMRFRRERLPLVERARAGQEFIRHMAGRFFIHRLENVGATGYRRSWTDNILWHHFCHFVDLGMWLFAEGDGAAPADGALPGWVRRVQGFMPDVHPQTGIPMEAVVLVETARDQSFLVHGSYHAAWRLYDKLLVTDRDTWFFDILAGTLKTRDGTTAIEDEQTNCARVTHDFVAAVREGRQPFVSGPSVLPAMAVLQAVQDDWDRAHGARALPGRPL